MLKNRYIKQILSIILLSSMLVSCASTNAQNQPIRDKQTNNTQQGAIIGAFVGALIGIASKGKNKGKRVLLGGALGAAIGGGIGYSMDKQAEELAVQLDSKVDNSPQALLDPSNDLIISNTNSYVKITLRQSMMFKTNSFIPTKNAALKIDKISTVLRRYPNTIVQVVGFTDSRGTYEYNQILSEKRAASVGDIIYNSGINNQVFSKGCSYNNPIIVNTSKKNMALNRRVEIYLYQSEANIIDACSN